MIKCKSCGEAKSPESFYKNNEGTCKACRKIYVSKRYQSKKQDPNFKATAAARMRKYRAANPEYAKREKAKAKANPVRRKQALGYALKRQAATKEFINTFKQSPCMDCTQSFPPHVMDFDHVRGDKVNNIGEMGNYSVASILEEISKCDLVCANCHRIRTYNRQHSL